MKALRAVAIGILCSVAVPNAAQACSNLLPEAAERLRMGQVQFLHRFSDVVVYGTFTETARTETETGLHQQGFIAAREGRTERRYPISFTPALNCGFPRFPEAGETGLFYLRIDSPNFVGEDYFPPEEGQETRDDDPYDILHFEEARRGD